MIRNQKGFTLTELIAGIVLASLLFTGFTLFYIQYLKDIHEINDYNQLQTDVITLLEDIRHGTPQKNVNDQVGLIGLMTASQVIIGNDNSLKMIPIITDTGAEYWAKYRLNNKGQVVLDVAYRTNRINNRVIFPKSDEKIDNQYKYQVTNFSITSLTPAGSVTRLVNVKIEAEVRYRARGPKVSKEDDLRNNIGKVSFETVVYVGNAKQVTQP